MPYKFYDLHDFYKYVYYTRFCCHYLIWFMWLCIEILRCGKEVNSKMAAKFAEWNRAAINHVGQMTKHLQISIPIDYTTWVMFLAERSTQSFILFFTCYLRLGLFILLFPCYLRLGLFMLLFPCYLRLGLFILLFTCYLRMGLLFTD